MLSERPEGRPRDALQRVILATPRARATRSVRANMAEYVSLRRRTRTASANPADKDRPGAFDNTYNSPEHDASVMK